jgi:uncharacterized protein (DUF1684 family)
MPHYHPADYLDLYDFRRRVFALYAERNRAVQSGEAGEQTVQRFREGRDELFARHPQSALDAEQRQRFTGLSYFPYDADACVEAVVDTQISPEELRVDDGERSMGIRRVGLLRFQLRGQEAALTLYWVDVYGGGLFLPFRDATSRLETYGGGRYLVDTVKGSDVVRVPSVSGEWRVLLDFNYAYNPSCAYNYRWVCPLAPPENHLPMAIRAGEKTYADQHDLP